MVKLSSRCIIKGPVARYSSLGRGSLSLTDFTWSPNCRNVTSGSKLTVSWEGGGGTPPGGHCSTSPYPRESIAALESQSSFI